MPAVNWFFATVFFLFLCGMAIAAPFALGLWSVS